MPDRFDSSKKRTNGYRHQSVPVDAPFSVDFVHRLRFTTGAFDRANTVLTEVLSECDDSPGRMVVFVDRGVADAWPDLADDVEAYLAHNLGWMSLAAPVQVVTGGEAAKNDWTVFQDVARTINEAAICRHSYVMAIGGGAMIDAVGYAASSAHRGVRLVRLPTTTLGQGDAGIGVKNGINAFGKKNFLGAFDVPWAVVNDDRFLMTLSDRDWRCGISEAVKVACLKDVRLFEAIESHAEELARRDHSSLRPIIRRSAELHLQHIVAGGDPFELNEARPLDFGHWSAHKLEQLSNFEIRHGEAVAMGIAIDVLYSAMMGMIGASEAERIVKCLQAVGFELFNPWLKDPALFEGLEEFREHLGGRLTITLLNGIGDPVDVHEIDTDRMAEAIEQVGVMVGEEGTQARRHEGT